MKTYEVELRRTSFITVWVKAEDKDKAEVAAWADASWEISAITELVTK